jgi:hypothetical protein
MRNENQRKTAKLDRTIKNRAIWELNFFLFDQSPSFNIFAKLLLLLLLLSFSQLFLSIHQFFNVIIVNKSDHGMPDYEEML